MIFFFILFSIAQCISAFTVLPHPLEPKCAYIKDLKISNIKHSDKEELRKLFKQHPLLIVKDNNLKPKEFIDFLTIFDLNCDHEAISCPANKPLQILQPFDQFPDCNHVAPRGNFKRENYYNIKNIDVKPAEPFINNYIWHTDLIGHKTKLPGVVTGFHIIEQPLIGGDTDFISGETIYQNMPENIKIACSNILIEINRVNLVFNKKSMDYSGSIINSHSDTSFAEDVSYLPIMYEDNCILVQASMFEKVVGWNKEDSKEWLKNFMRDYVLPHRFSVQWKEGDIGVINNRKFSHSSTPANNYLSYSESNKRLLFQTFLPTKSPIYYKKPDISQSDIHHTVGWTDSKEMSQVASLASQKYCETMEKTYNEFMISEKINKNNDYYIGGMYPIRNFIDPFRST